MNESSAGLSSEHGIPCGTVHQFRLFSVGLLLALIGLAVFAGSSRAADHTITVNSARLSIGTVFPDNTIIPAPVMGNSCPTMQLVNPPAFVPPADPAACGPSPLSQLVPNYPDGNGKIKVSEENGTATVAAADFKVPMTYVPNPTTPGQWVPIRTSAPNGLTGTWNAVTGELSLTGDLRINFATGTNPSPPTGPNDVSWCRIDAPGITWSTGLNPVYPGVPFTGSLSGDGALAVAWSDLPDGGEINGGDCSTVNAIIHDIGALWLSSGIADPPEAPVCEPPLEGLWPDCQPGLGGPAPANDNFADAEVLDGNSTQLSGTTVDSTFQSWEPDHHDQGATASVWYQWTPTQSGTAVVDACDYDGDTGSIDAIAAYTGTAVGSLTERGSGYCRVSFPVVANTTYQIAVASYDGNPTSFTLKADIHQPPVNDNFASAQVLAGNSPQVVGTTTGATIQTGEPDHYGEGSPASVWYQWTPTQSGTAVVDACDYDGNTGEIEAVAAYTGSSFSGLNERGSGYCRMGFPVVANTTYRIAIASYSASGPDFTLKAGVHQPPANDSFASAQVLTGSSAQVTGTTTAATLQAGEPDHDNQGALASVWYQWTPTQSGTATIDVCDAGNISAVAAYTGTAISSLSEVGSGYCRLRFSATANTTYRIAAATYSIAGTDFTLKVNLVQPPVNDSFADATVIIGNSTQMTGTTVGATVQASEPDHNEEGASASVWYQWTPTQSGTAVVEACDYDADTGDIEAIAAYTGTAIGSLTERGAGYCRMSLPVVANTTYRIAVASHDGNPTSFTLKADVHQPPPNDNFASAQALTGGSPQVTGTTTAATIEVNEPDHHEQGTSASVWYQWTPTQSGTAIIDVCDYSGDVAAVAAYTGNAVGGLSGVGSGYCSASFQATANVTYRIAVASYSGSGASFTLKAGIFQPPANDNFADATVITGNPAHLTGDNSGASHEAGEPNHSSGGGGGSLWYRWTAPGNGNVVIDTCGSDFDTYLAAYTGTALANLDLVSRDDDACGRTSEISFPVTSGTTYRIAVDGYGSSSRGSVNLNLNFTPTGGPAQFNLTVYSSGDGAGRVTSAPAGIDCGSDCTESYAGGTTVTLTANAATGSSFSGWSGACSSGSAICQVTMSQARNVTAEFAKDPVPPAYFKLTLNRSGDGQGRVTSTPAGIDCGTDCSENYVDGTTVTLTATADTGSSFSGWSGACSGRSANCQVTMSQARNVTATFEDLTPPPARFELTVTKSGDGQGRVTSTPAGIDCGADCSEKYDDGTTVTLTATAETGSSFSGWSGACSGSSANCEVSMDQARSVTASFWSEAAPAPPPTAARVDKITAARKGKVQRGKTATIKVKVKNAGGKTLKGKLQIRSSNRQVKPPKSARLNVKPGKTQTIKVKVKTTKKAKGKAKITFRAGGKKAVTTLTVKK